MSACGNARALPENFDHAVPVQADRVFCLIHDRRVYNGTIGTFFGLREVKKHREASRARLQSKTTAFFSQINRQ
jgi:hypothetical protein